MEATKAKRKSTPAQLAAARRYREKKKRDREELKETLRALDQMEDFR